MPEEFIFIDASSLVLMIVFGAAAGTTAGVAAVITLALLNMVDSAIGKFRAKNR